MSHIIRGNSSYTDNDLFPFGKHSGEKFINVPADYLLYIYDMPWIKEWPGVELYIHENFDELLAEQSRERANKKPIGS